MGKWSRVEKLLLFIGLAICGMIVNTLAWQMIFYLTMG